MLTEENSTKSFDDIPKKDRESSFEYKCRRSEQGGFLDNTK